MSESAGSTREVPMPDEENFVMLMTAAVSFSVLSREVFSRPLLGLDPKGDRLFELLDQYDTFLTQGRFHRPDEPIHYFEVTYRPEGQEVMEIVAQYDSARAVYRIPTTQVDLIGAFEKYRKANPTSILMRFHNAALEQAAEGVSIRILIADKPPFGTA